MRNTQRQYLGYNTPLGHHTDRGLMGLGQYGSLGSIVTLILLLCVSYSISGYMMPYQIAFPEITLSSNISHLWHLAYRLQQNTI